jgi:hypothetical protein
MNTSKDLPEGCCPPPPCLQYIPFTDVPEEIHAAAQIIHTYFAKQGVQEWEFSYIADRRLVTKLERERDELRSALLELHNHYREWSIPGTLYKQVESALYPENARK